VPPSRLRYRRIHDGGILFDEHTWNTHVLNPAAAAIYEALLQRSQGKPAPSSETLQLVLDELGLNPDTQEIRELLPVLKRLGVVL